MTGADEHCDSHFHNGNAMPDFSALVPILLASLQANCKIFTMVCLGVIATFQGVFDSKGISDMGRLVYRITLPALLFSKILKEFSMDRLSVLYWLPIFCAMHACLAFAIARILSLVLGISPFETRVVTGSIMFGNVGALAIAVITTLCNSEPLATEVGHVCEARAVSYVAFYLITQNLLMFSWGESLLFAPTPTDAVEDEVCEVTGAVVDSGGVPERSDQTPIRAGASFEAGGYESSELGSTTEPGAEPDVPSFLHTGPAQYGTSSAPPSCRLPPRQDSPGTEEKTSLTGLRIAGSSGDLYGHGGRLTDHLKRQRFKTSAAPVRLPLQRADGVVVRRSNSFVYSFPTATTPPEQGTRGTRNSARGGAFGGALPATLSYHEIQQAASRVGLEVHAFHPRHHASTSMLVGEAGDTDLADEKEVPLLQDEPNTFAVVVEHGATLQGMLTVAAMRLHSVLTGVLKNPPIQAALVAILLAAYPPVKALLMGPSAPFRFVSAAVETLGQGQVPISMLMLSGSGTINYMKKLKSKLEAQGADLAPFAFSLRTEVAVIIGRLVMLPACGYLVFHALVHWLGWLPTSDPLLLLVLLIESAVPTAQNLIMMLLVHGDIVEGEAMASVLLRQYAVSMVTFTAATAVFQAIVFG